MTYANQYAHDNSLSEEDRYNDLTTSTYVIVHIPDQTPELPSSALGAHVTIRTNDDLVPCTGDCGELVPDPRELGDPYCESCALALVPADVRAMRQAPSSLARDIAALPEAAYFSFWGKLLHEYLADPPADHDVDALSDAVEHFAQDRDTLRSLSSLAPTGPAALPARLAG